MRKVKEEKIVLSHTHTHKQTNTKQTIKMHVPTLISPFSKIHSLKSEHIHSFFRENYQFIAINIFSKTTHTEHDEFGIFKLNGFCPLCHSKENFPHIIHVKLIFNFILNFWVCKMLALLFKICDINIEQPNWALVKQNHLSLFITKKMDGLFGIDVTDLNKSAGNGCVHRSSRCMV